MAGSLTIELREDIRLNPNKNYIINFLSYDQGMKQCEKTIWDGYQIQSATVRNINFKESRSIFNKSKLWLVLPICIMPDNVLLQV